MNQQDRDLWDEHTKRMDERHGALMTYLSTEFERTNKHLSKLNGRMDGIEKKTSFAQWVQKNPLWSMVALIIVIALLIGLVDLIGLVNVLKLV